MARILSLHIGSPEPLRGRPERYSAIRKVPAQGPVALGLWGLEGDSVVDRRYHGGPFKALCAYASEYYARWEEVFGVAMPAGSFGENLALAGLTDDQVCLGDVYTIGDARVRVAGPRGPCSTLAAHWGTKDLHLAVKRERRTGFYLSVLQPAVVAAGMDMELRERPSPHWTLPAFWDALDARGTPAEVLDELLGMEGLDDDWKPKLRAKRRQSESLS